jgi:sulfur relay (sulfurtransferase) complex TusBCD TusD component (DsrE family)
MKIGFLLMTSPEHQDGFTVYSLAQEFLDMGVSVEIFLMEDGVYHGVRNPSLKKLSPSFPTLLKKGASISVCSFNTEIRGLGEKDLVEGVKLQSQYDLSHLVAACDRFLAFG